MPSISDPRSRVASSCVVTPLVSGLLVLLGGRSGGLEGKVARHAESGPSRQSNRVVVLGQVSDEELAALYTHASAVAVPSRWEGYSFPVAEALACGAEQHGFGHVSCEARVLPSQRPSW